MDFEKLVTKSFRQEAPAFPEPDYAARVLGSVAYLETLFFYLLFFYNLLKILKERN
jgi:hypothetical protein